MLLTGKELLRTLEFAGFEVKNNIDEDLLNIEYQIFESDQGKHILVSDYPEEGSMLLSN